MKKTLLFFVFIITASSLVFSQEFKHNISGTFGILNPKVRIQYEAPLKDRASFGANLNYYFVNWSGPIVEPFVRIYGRKSGNAEGFFGQLKLAYGNLSTIDFDKIDYQIENRRWSTFGAGIAGGYKFLLGNSMTIELLSGLRIVSGPTYRYKPGYDATSLGEALGEEIGWYITTGLPFDFQAKVGYQF
jgi:hypothetical protein